jgi:hypothetical protein
VYEKERECDKGREGGERRREGVKERERGWGREGGRV